MFVLKIASLSEGLIFSAQTAEVIMTVLIFLDAIIVCFLGRRFLTASILGVIGLVSGYLGILVAQTMTSSNLIFLIFFTVFASLGFCAAFFISVIAGAVFESAMVKKVMNNNAWWLTAVSGAIASAAVCYFWIFRSVTAAVIILAAAGGGGMIYQYRARKNEKPYYTYANIYKMAPLGGEGKSNNDIENGGGQNA